MFPRKIEKTKKPKYNNKKTIVDGISFDSAKEAKRYGELKLLQKYLKIDHLVLQPKFKIIINGIKVCEYWADFQYHDLDKNEIIVEDCKGFRTKDYIIKRKLMLALHGIKIFET